MISNDNEQLSYIVNTIEKQGYVVMPSFISEKILSQLESRIKSFKNGNLKEANIGSGRLKQSNQNIRRDKIYWLKQENSIDNQFLKLMEDLRVGLNQSLYLGLFDYESHYAVYQKGDFYKQHVDALKGKSNRVLSTVLYLNEDWGKQNDGELLLYGSDGKTILETVTPNAGTMVMFLSEKFPHEVLAAKETRYSIAGWFRVNASNSRCVDTSS